MTRGSVMEYTQAVRGRYLRASKKGKGRIDWQRLGQSLKDLGFQGMIILEVGGAGEMRKNLRQAWEGSLLLS